MDDLQIIIYIVFIVLYFLSRALRKKKSVVEKAPKSPQATDPEVSRNENTPRKKPVTFEELLQELEGNPVESEPDVEYEEPEYEEPEKKPDPQPVLKPEYEKYMKEGGLKTQDNADDLDTLLKRRFDTYQIQEKENIHTASRYRKLLKSSDSIKDAIILKEILDRKKF